MPLVYTEHHCCRPSATPLPVWLDMADPPKMVVALKTLTYIITNH